MINKEYFLNQIDQYMGVSEEESTVSIKYIYERVSEILNMDDYADVAYSLSRLMDELAHNYLVDTGHGIGEDL